MSKSVGRAVHLPLAALALPLESLHCGVTPIAPLRGVDLGHLAGAVAVQCQLLIEQEWVARAEDEVEGEAWLTRVELGELVALLCGKCGRRGGGGGVVQ